MTFTLLAVAAVLAVAPMPDVSAPGPRCLHTNGLVDGPFVPTAVTAAAIYRAVRMTVGDGLRPEFPEVEVTDAGGHWEVMEARKPTPSDGADVTRGGGQFYLRIDKCTGAISGAAYNR
jgi:hypothetical protein